MSKQLTTPDPGSALALEIQKTLAAAKAANERLGESIAAPRAARGKS